MNYTDRGSFTMLDQAFIAAPFLQSLFPGIESILY